MTAFVLFMPFAALTSAAITCATAMLTDYPKGAPDSSCKQHKYNNCRNIHFT